MTLPPAEDKPTVSEGEMENPSSRAETMAIRSLRYDPVTVKVLVTVSPGLTVPKSHSSGSMVMDGTTPVPCA